MNSRWFAWCVSLVLCASCLRSESALVLQTDFGTKDGAVASMRGVAVGISPAIRLFDLSHENTPFNVWEAAYRLNQTAPYWPAGTVFVSVVDPGVGTERAAVVMRTKSGHYFVGPDNGTWTLVAEALGIDAVREIDPAKHQREGSNRSYTFHGRDLFVVIGAKLAAGQVSFDEVGPLLPEEVQRIPYERARIEREVLVGTIPYLDFQYGNVWTNIGDELFARTGARPGDVFRVVIMEGKRVVFEGRVPYARTFGDVPKGAPLIYLNSLLHVAVALNQASFAGEHRVGYGGEWSIRLEKTE